ncbi:MAG: MATE family efflux transporter [Ruminococcus callidus]
MAFIIRFSNLPFLQRSAGNTLITVVAFHYGRREKARLRQCVRYGLLYAAGLMLIVTVLFQLFAAPISGLFQSDSAAGKCSSFACGLCVSVRWAMCLWESLC